MRGDKTGSKGKKGSKLGSKEKKGSEAEVQYVTEKKEKAGRAETSRIGQPRSDAAVQKLQRETR